MFVHKKKAQSLELLSKHQLRIQGMIRNISKYQPTYHLNKTYRPYDFQKAIDRREEQAEKLFEENMKLIIRIQTTGPKVQTKRFPQIIPNPKRLKTLSEKKKVKSPPKVVVKDSYRNDDQLFEENLKIINTIETTGPKVQCWRPKKLQQFYQQRTLRKIEEEKKMLNKFKQISKQFHRLHMMSSFRGSIKGSPRTTIKQSSIDRNSSTKLIRYKTEK